MKSNYAIERAWLQIGLDSNRHWGYFENPVESIVIDSPHQLKAGLRKVEGLQESGYWVVGYITYEGSTGLDEALKNHEPDQPVLSFAAFRDYEKKRLPAVTKLADQPKINIEDLKDWHQSSVHKIKQRISAGDTYQINLTYPITGEGAAEAFELFQLMNYSAGSPYTAYLESQRLAICSASPELFFQKHGDSILMKPMKGTRPRHADPTIDAGLATELADSEKDRAENLMICDMVRNDLARIAKPGTLKTSDIAAIESYPTVFQTTTTVTAETAASFSEIIESIFPAASITGAPKYSATQIIKELEVNPRGIYTGTIGWLSPDGSMSFNVAIRTAVVDKDDQKLTFGVGGGIVADSDAQAEYDESLVKSRIIQSDSITLFETILHTENGFTLLDYHLERLLDSAQTAGISITSKQLISYLDSVKDSHQPDTNWVIRIDVSQLGEISHQIRQVPDTVTRPSVNLDSVPVDRDDYFLQNKTSQRSRYNQAETEGFFDTICWNQDDEVTEATKANVVVKLEGGYYTPPVSSGLLNGTLRQRLIDSGLVLERVIYKSELADAHEMYLVNSVRGWIRVNYEQD